MLSKDEIIERLNDVFRDVFDDDTLEVDENTTLMISRIGTLSSISLLSAQLRTSSR